MALITYRLIIDLSLLYEFPISCNALVSTVFDAEEVPPSTQA